MQLPVIINLMIGPVAIGPEITWPQVVL